MSKPQNTKDPPPSQLIRVTDATFPVTAYLQFILASLSIFLGDCGYLPYQVSISILIVYLLRYTIIELPLLPHSTQFRAKPCFLNPSPTQTHIL